MAREAASSSPFYDCVAWELRRRRRFYNRCVDFARWHRDGSHLSSPNTELIFRSNYWQVPEPRLSNAACWLLVAMSAAVPLGSATMLILGALVLIAFIAAGGFSERWSRVRSNPFALMSIALFVLIALGASWSTASSDEILRVSEKHARLLFAVIAIALLTDAKWRRRALVAWMLAMLATLLLSYLHSMWAFPLARATREAAVGDHYIFKHHITQNVMMSVFAAAALIEALRAWRAGARQLASIWLFLCAAAAINVLFFVIGRTGYITLVVSLVVVSLMLGRARQRLALVSFVAVALTALVINSQNVHQQLETVVAEVETHSVDGAVTSTGMRMEFARRSIELIAERPIVGWGTGAYSREFCRVAHSLAWCRAGQYNPHNQFLFFGVQLGLLGVAAYLLWVASAAYVLRSASTYERALGFALLATLLIHSMLDSPLYIVTESTWYPLMLAILCAGYSNRSRSQSNARAASATSSTEGHSG
jgi:O-antigen ligase